MSENKKGGGDAAKWVGFGAGAALGSAALAAAVMYVARARDKAKAEGGPAKVVEAED